MHRHPELAISLMRAVEAERLAEARERRRDRRPRGGTRGGDMGIDAAASEPRATEATGLRTARAKHVRGSLRRRTSHG